MRVTDVQLKLLLPVVIKESKENPSKEWDVLLERMITLALKRRLVNTVRALMPDHPLLDVSGETGEPEPRNMSRGSTHPLLQDAGDAMDVASRPAW